MRILILGGTVFLGRHVVADALARGHELTLYTRGLHGSRPRTASSTSAATAPTSRRCAAARGTRRSTPPATTRRTSPPPRALDVGHYVFVSTCNAYPAGPTSRSTRTRRRGRTARATARTRPRPSAHVLPGAAPPSAPGLIVGPHDNVFRLPWWVRRIAPGRRRARAGAPGPAAADDRRARSRGLPARPRRAARRRARSTAPAPIGQTTMGELLAPRATPSCAGSPTRRSRRRRRAVDRAAAVAAGGLRVAGRHRARAGRGPALPAGRRDRRRHRRLAARRRRGRARRLALRAPPAADERRARGGAAQSSVSPTQPPARSAGRDRPQAGADVLDVLVEPVGAAEPRLQRHERRGVAHEGEEEQAGVELALALVEAVGERVAAAQDPRALVREPDVAATPAAAAARTASNSPDGRAARPTPCGARSSAPGRRATRGPRPRSASGSGARRGSCRRAASPARRTQTCSVERRGVLELEVVGAVLEAHQVARRGLLAARRRRAPEAELRPAERRRAAGDPGEVADGVERDLRIVGAGLHAEVAAAAGGGRARRRGSAGSSRSAGGRFDASPKRSSNSDGPKPNVIVRRAGSRPSASPVSSGGASGSALAGPAGSPAVIRAAAATSRAAARRRSAPGARSKAAKWSRSCAGVAMPAWWAPANGTVAGGAAESRVSTP